MNQFFFTHMKLQKKVCYESGTDNRLPGTKLWTPGTKGPQEARDNIGLCKFGRPEKA